MQVFDVRFHDFWVALEKGGEYKIEVVFDHPQGNLSACHTKRVSPAETVSERVLRPWWGSWDLDVMYETKYVSQKPNTGWVETDTGLSCKRLTVGCKSKNVYAKAEIPLSFFVCGPKQHAVYLFDGEQYAGVAYYKTLAAHKGFAGRGLSVLVERFTVTESSTDSWLGMSGEWEWHGHSVKTPAKDPPKEQGEWLELATGCEALWNKGESLEDLLLSPFRVRVRQGDIVMWKESHLREFVHTLKVLDGVRKPDLADPHKGKSTVSFSLKLEAGASHWARVFVQLQVTDCPKYATMIGGVLTQREKSRDPDSFIVHHQAFNSPIVQYPCERTNLTSWHEAQDPTPLLWGFPIPSLRYDTPIEITRKDGLEVACKYGNAWFSRPYGTVLLPVDWSEHQFSDPVTGKHRLYFRDNHPDASYESIWVPPGALPHRWCARTSRCPEHKTPQGPLTYYYPENEPQKAQWAPPRCLRGYCAVPLPPDWCAKVVKSGKHAGTVFYQQTATDGTHTTSWDPPDLPLIQEARKNDWYAEPTAELSVVSPAPAGRSPMLPTPTYKKDFQQHLCFESTEEV
ncbi:hypothetical protein DIPPA_10868 [Diplonema papillatum]|nr:hypothetical protein DIPPA_10868 [Diplonema papillatum]